MEIKIINIGRMVTYTQEQLNQTSTIVHLETQKRNTKKAKAEMKLQRFTDPIQSFPGNTPTVSEMELITKLAQFFKK